MLDNNHENLPKRTLKKVRRQFLNKQPDENEPQPAEPLYDNLEYSRVYAIKASVGLVEVGRKISIGPQFLNLYFNIKSSFIESQLESKAVTLNLSLNENHCPVPWEYSVKRLESFGDLELATWANKIRNHYLNYPTVMGNYYNLLHSNDPNVYAAFRKAKSKALLTCKEIESKYSYNKAVQFLGKNTNDLISCSYSEGFLKEIGHTPESFLNWARENGLPHIFERKSLVYVNIIKDFLDCVSVTANPVQEGTESETILYDKEGHKKKVMARFITVLEPTPEGPYLYCYFIINKNNNANSSNQGHGEAIIRKCIKKGNGKEESESCLEYLGENVDQESQ